jgi:peptidoglycan-associated lipoprotein
MQFLKFSVACVLLMMGAACAPHKRSMSTSTDSMSSYPVVASEELAVGVKNTVYFDYNSSKLSDEYKLVAESQAEWIKTNNIHSVVIAGYCDERGTVEYNLALGARRAEALKNALVANGVDKKKITVVSYGKDQPNPNYARKMPNEDGYQDYLSYNRRAVVTVE